MDGIKEPEAERSKRPANAMRVFWGFVALIVLLAAAATMYSRFAHAPTPAKPDPAPWTGPGTDPSQSHTPGMSIGTPDPKPNSGPNSTGKADPSRAGDPSGTAKASKQNDPASTPSNSANGAKPNNPDAITGRDSKPDPKPDSKPDQKLDPKPDQIAGTTHDIKSGPDGASDTSPTNGTKPQTLAGIDPSSTTDPKQQGSPDTKANANAGNAGTPPPTTPITQHQTANASSPAGPSASGTPTTQSVPSAPLNVAPSGTLLTYAKSMLGDFQVKPGEFETREDGSIKADGKFILRGEGTRMKPYIVPWNLLVSCENDFDPSHDKRAIPERIAMLHDRFVKVDGYVAFPMMMQNPRELLVMLNQWDGCCIGIPPTSYDAVEVKLKDSVKGDARFATSGNVEGRFQIKPYLVSSWLISLYVIEEAKFQPLEITGGEQ